jgi:hypothetical protein
MRPLLEQAIVVFVTLSQQRREGGRADEPLYGLRPLRDQGAHQQMQRKVRSLRLEERLREERGSSGSRLVALAKRGVRPLLREVHRAG